MWLPEKNGQVSLYLRGTAHSNLRLTLLLCLVLDSRYQSLQLVELKA
jgi:hypothetical protein